MSGHFRPGIIHDSKPVLDHWTILEKGLHKLIYDNFRNYKDFSVISNIKKYKPSGDASIFAQKIGRMPEICEVYMNGEYICDVSIMDRPAQALTKINDGLIELMTNKKFVENRIKKG